MAQWIERKIPDLEVGGSTPLGRTYMKREFSAGGIIFNKQGQVLLTKNSSNKHWGFPKGNPNEGESMKDAALREVSEEAGVTAEIITKVGDSHYVYTHPESKEKIFKIVSIYLMRYLFGDPKDHDWEVSEAIWAEPEKAFNILSFFADKQLLKKALELKNG